MKLLKSEIHPSLNKVEGNCFERVATRAIVIKNNKILLMFTKRYNDYSVPGGGVDSGENLIEALKRELKEETGARNVSVKAEIGTYEEYRPIHYPEYDYMHMVSYIYLCEIDDEMDEPTFEDYEIKNGMSVEWVDIDEAIKHNEEVMKSKDPSMGFSIGRETFIMKLVKEKYM